MSERRPLETPMELRALIDAKDAEVARLRAELAALYEAADAFYAKADYTVPLEIDGRFSSALMYAQQAISQTNA